MIKKLDTMENTTIAIPVELKEQIQEFGFKGEKYSEIILRLLKSAKERQLHDLLMDETDTISIDVALDKAKKRWR
jgi:hypothetical protein